jgi:hypothetical protein
MHAKRKSNSKTPIRKNKKQSRRKKSNYSSKLISSSTQLETLSTTLSPSAATKTITSLLGLGEKNQQLRLLTKEEDLIIIKYCKPLEATIQKEVKKLQAIEDIS